MTKTVIAIAMVISTVKVIAIVTDANIVTFIIMILAVVRAIDIAIVRR